MSRFGTIVIGILQQLQAVTPPVVEPENTFTDFYLCSGGIYKKLDNNYNDFKIEAQVIEKK